MSHADRIAAALKDLRPCGAVSSFGRWQADLCARPASLAARMAALGVPGVALAMIDDDDVAWSGGFGELARGRGQSIDADTRFQAGSISKPVFALGVMRLVEAGMLDLDEDVNTYLTAWKLPANGAWRPRVTLRQLLSHTAGTGVHGFPGYATGKGPPSAVDVLNGAPGVNTPAVAVELTPGLQQRYSGGGTTIAQQVVVDVLGAPFPAIMRALVLDPAGMASSTYAQPLPEALAERSALGHDADGLEVAGRWHAYPEMAAAGLWTTANDLARLAIELLRTLQGAPASLGLKRESLEAMLRPQLPDQGGGGEFIGLGWICDGTGEAFSFGHTGGNEGFVANIRLFPRRGRGGLVLTNGQGGGVLQSELLSAVGRAYGWPGDPAAMASIPLSLAQALVGDWRGERGFEVSITLAGGRLNLNLPGQPPLALAACGERELYAEGLNLRLLVAGDGALTLRQPGRTLRFRRLA